MALNREWHEKLSGCCDDCGICCCGYWCAPCLFGKNAEKIDGESCCACCCVYWLLGHFCLCWIPHMMERKKLREKYGLKEDPCGDCPTTFFCSQCALCQEAREMKTRAKEPAVIFVGNNGAPIVHQPGANVVVKTDADLSRGYPGGIVQNDKF